MIKKTVLEWVSYRKITAGKIKKLKAKLSDCYDVRYSSETKKIVDSDVIGDYDSLINLSINYEKVSNALIQFNANTIIEVAGEKMTMVRAIERYREISGSKDTSDYTLFEKIDRVVDTMGDKIAKKQENSLSEKSEIDKSLLSRPNISEKDKIIAENLKSQYDVIIDDPINIRDIHTRLREQKDLFMEQVNNKINLCNALNSINIDID